MEDSSGKERYDCDFSRLGIQIPELRPNIDVILEHDIKSYDDLTNKCRK